MLTDPADEAPEDEDNKRLATSIAYGIPVGLLGGAVVGLLTDNFGLCAGLGLMLGIVGGSMVHMLRKPRDEQQGNSSPAPRE